MKQDLIWQLVHSLSKAEKRAFVIESQRIKKDGGYLDLFRWYAQQKTAASPDAAQIKLMRLTKNRLAVQKNYLSVKLTEFIARSTTQQSDAVIIRNMLIQAEALLRRGLHEQAAKLLRKAHTMAKKAHAFVLELDAYEIQEAYSGSYADINRIKECTTEKLRLLPVLKNLYTCQLFSYETLELAARYDFARSPEQRKEMARFAQHSMLKSTAKGQSISARYFLLHSRLHFTSMAQNPAENIRAAVEHLQLFDEDRQTTAHEINYYITIVHNIAAMMLMFGSEESEKAVLNRWDSLCSEYAHALDDVSLMRYRFYQSELVMRIGLLNGDIDKMVRELPKIKLLLKQEHIYKPIFEQTITFYMALAGYAQQRYRQAHQLLRDNVTDVDVNSRRYRILLRSLLLRLMIHCDQHNDDAVEYLTNELKQIIIRQNCTGYAEGLLPEFFKAWLQSAPQKRPLLMQNTYTAIRKRYEEQKDWQFGSGNLFFNAWLWAGAKNISWQKALSSCRSEYRQRVRQLIHLHEF